MKKIDDEIILNALYGKSTPEDDRLIEEWYRESPEECRRSFDDMHAIADLYELEEVEKKQKRLRKAALWKKTAVSMAAAASISSVVALSVYISHMVTMDSVYSLTTVIEAPKGEIIHITLPDSTSVCLNSGARIEYPSVFRKDSRNVTLEGEAYFDVTYDSMRPFTVHTFATDIQVLGTTFNINTDEKANEFTAILVEGKVKVTNRRNSGESLIMHPDDMVSLRNGHLQYEGHYQPSDICWTEGLIDLKGQSFESLIRKFEKAYGVDIAIERDTVPEMGDISGEIRISDGIDHAMKVLQHITDFKYSKDQATGNICIR